MGSVSAILTAAGNSVRMGRPKALLTWRGVTLVEYQVRCLIQGGASKVVVVLGHNADAVVPYVERSGAAHVVNHDYRLGKTTSIKVGLRRIDSGADAILLLAVDQPRTPEIVSTLVQSHVERDALVTSPTYKGHGAHPLVFSSLLKGELGSISEERQGVREILRAHRDDVNQVPIDDPIVRLDLNTPQEYDDALARHEA